MELKLDKEQRRAVLTELSAVVSAGAGSGKTTVLSQRFLHLLASGKAGVDEILALTFTRKAAAEMYERIYRNLLSAFPEAAAEYDKASISTLDSFCARIVRDKSSCFGITSDFVQDDLKVEEIARSTALEVMLRHGSDPALASYIDLYGFEGVLEKLFVKLATGYFTLADRKSISEELETQHLSLKKEIAVLERELAQFLHQLTSLDPSAHENIEKAVKTVSGLLPLEFDGDKPELVISTLEALAAVFVKPKGRVSKPDLLLFKEYVDQWRLLYASISSAAEALAARPLFIALGTIVDEFRLAFEKQKRITGIVSFRDVPAMAVQLLEDDPHYRRSWKNRYRYIMIDEFQDNNDLQRRLLYLLAEKPERTEKGVPEPEELVPGKLYFVGDEKQSIYRFRGADVGVFKRLSLELDRCGGDIVELPRNYRSEPALITFFNRFFPGIFGDAKEDYEARFSVLKSREESGGVSSRINLFYFPKDGHLPDGGNSEEYLGAAECEAWFIARKIRDFVEGRELSLPDGKSAGYNDIALLMRSSSNQIHYERAFRRLGVPYSVQSPRALFLEAPVNDFYQMLQLALYPEDRLAYVSLLRSPFAALSDHVIAALMLREQEEGISLPFTLKPEDPLFEGEGERYRNAALAWKMVCNDADRLPLQEIIRSLWFEWGYRYALLRDPGYHVYLEYYHYLFEFALRSWGRGETLASFLAFIRDNLGKYEKIEDLEPPGEEIPGVHIMSIHKSKGLEFPVVFVVGCGSTGRREGEGASPFYLHRSYGITFAHPSSDRKSGKGNFFYQKGKEQEEEQELAEIKRLLYVAATRAEQHLFFSGYHNRSNGKMDGTGRFSFLNWIGAGLGASGTEGWERDPALEGFLELIPPVPTAETEQISGAGKRPVPLQRARDAYSRAEEMQFNFPRSSYAPSSLAAAVECPPPKESDRPAPEAPLEIDDYLDSEERITAFGTLCHQAVELGLSPLGLPSASPTESLVIPAALVSLPQKVIDRCTATAVDLAEQFLRSEPGMGALKAARSGRQVSEVAFVYRTDKGRFIDGTIDIMIEDEDEVLVVDLKSDRGINPLHHYPQLSLYREAAFHLTGKPVRTLLWYLRSATAVEADPDPQLYGADILIDQL
jgi:ATP-dependent exoDNAse (exonuclease V) beta subunit